MWRILLVIKSRDCFQATAHPDLGTERAGQGSAGEGEARADARQQLEISTGKC